MIKLFFTGLIIYGIYKFFIAPASLPLNDSSSANSATPNENPNSSDGDYIDYEEID